METSFVRTTKYVPDFNGNKNLPEDQQIKVTLRSMTLGDYFDVLDTLAPLQEADGTVDIEKVAKKGIGEMKPLLLLGARLLPAYTEITAVLDSEKNPMTPADIASAPFFLGLTAELIGKLAAISSPNTADLKN